MKIQEFKSKFKNPARNNLFYVRLTNIGKKGDMSPNDLEFFCKSVTIPGFNLKTFDYSSTNYGLTQMIPFGLNSEPLNCTFMLDSEHKVLDYFHHWMNDIVKYDKRNIKTSIRDQYELGYIEDYGATMEIYQLSSDGTYEGDRYVTRLTDVFPTNISSISMSWDENDSYATLPIQFSYSSIVNDKVINGSGYNAFSKITGNLTSYYFEAGRTSHGNSPVTSGSLQDFVDMKTKDKFDQLSDGYKIVSKII